ncbi:hypothetical protein LINPERPRIM_LOCUS4662, partial [Linum perenne]
QTQPAQHTYTDINAHFIYLGELIRRHKELFPRYPAGHHNIHIPQDLSPQGDNTTHPLRDPSSTELTRRIP